MGEKHTSLTAAAFTILVALVTATLTAPPASAWQASGANGQIAWGSGADGDMDIWVMNADGSGKHQVGDTDGGIDEYQPEWSPDASQIAYVRDEDGAGTTAKPTLWIMNADGSNAHRVFGFSGVTFWQPTWTPDGSHLILHANQSDDPALNSLQRLNIVTGELVAFGTGTGTYGWGYPFASADRVAVQHTLSGYTELGCLTPEGTVTAVSDPVATSSGGMYDPSLSADGKRWVYTRVLGNNDHTIEVGTACSNQGIVPIAGGNSFKAFPTFSPDGQRVAYVDGADGDWEIVSVSSVDGSGRQALTDNSVLDADPSWTAVPAPPPAPPPSTCMGKVATKVGTPGNDVIVGTAGNDVIVGGSGDDFIKAGKGNDIVCGGDGNDVIKGSAGKDKLYGENGNDVLKGGADPDLCDGGLGADKVKYCERRRNIP